MQAPKTNIGAIARAGRSAGKGVLDSFEVARAYSPDYTGMAVEGMKARGAEKTAAMKADANVANMKMQGKGLIKKTELKIETEKAVRDAKKQSAKGGMIAKAGGLISAGLMDDGPEKPTDYSMIRDLYNKREKELAADEAAFKPFERTVNPDTQEPIERVTTPRTGTPVAGAVSAAANIQPAASQQTAPKETVGITTSSNVKPSKTVSSMGFTGAEWQNFTAPIKSIESGGKYNIFGGSGDHYDGAYQMGAAAKTDAAKMLGIADPGHSPEARAAFRNNPQLQDQMFEGFTKANHTYLMRNPNYANASNQRKLEILGYAHNQGMGGANQWLKTGNVGRDGFGTAGTRYSDAIRQKFESGL